jgi:Zn finger protein HypA/HybF involved in hydrogenase expression
MHETGVIDRMFQVAAQVQSEHGGRPIAKFTVELSDFGGWDEEHFRQHFQEALRGSAWAGACLEVRRVKTGPEARLAGVSFTP